MNKKIFNNMKIMIKLYKKLKKKKLRKNSQFQICISKNLVKDMKSLFKIEGQY